MSIIAPEQTASPAYIAFRELLLQECPIRKRASVDPQDDVYALYLAEELEVRKLAQLASITIQEPCKACKQLIQAHHNTVGGGYDVVCPCGEKNFILPSEDHHKELIQIAEARTNTGPSKAQRGAGNYSKGKFGWRGFVISIENPKGSTRSGVSRSGHKWSTTMKDPYGYLLKHISQADGDHVDCFIGPDFSSQKVYIVDQNVNGRFDEHKVILMANDARQAKEIYDRNYQKSWDGFSNLTSMSLREFKDWLETGDTSRPVFVKVTQEQEKAVQGALDGIPDKLRGVDYGNVYLNARTKTMYLNMGDGWEKGECEAYSSACRKALPDWKLEQDCESIPPGYDHDNFGDWSMVKRK